MKSKELIKLILENDPSGEMEVILGADTGEGYIPLETVFADCIDKQQCDGDVISYSSDLALFLGDSNCEKSPLPKYKMELCDESKKKYVDEFEDPKVILIYSQIKSQLEEQLGVTTNIPITYIMKIWLDHDEQSLRMNYISNKQYFNPLFNINEFNTKMLEYLHTLDSISGIDTYSQDAKIVKLH